MKIHSEQLVFMQTSNMAVHHVTYCFENNLTLIYVKYIYQDFKLGNLKYNIKI